MTTQVAADLRAAAEVHEPDAVLVDGDWISPSREAHARDLTKAWADAAQNAGCPAAFVERMRSFVALHDRLHAAALEAAADAAEREAQP